MNKFQIWHEGHKSTGGTVTSYKLGECEGKDFLDACRNFAIQNPEFKKYFNEVKLTWFGLRLFNNEKDASKEIGTLS